MDAITENTTPPPADDPLVALLPHAEVAADAGPVGLALSLHAVMFERHDERAMMCAAVLASAKDGEPIGRPTLLQFRQNPHGWRYNTLLLDGDLKDQPWLQTEARKNAGKVAWSDLIAEETAETEHRLREENDAFVAAGLAPRYFYKTANGFRFVFVYDVAGTEAEQQKARAKKLSKFAADHGINFDSKAVDATRLMKVANFHDEHGQASDQPWWEAVGYSHGAVLETAKLDAIELPAKDIKAGKATHYDICITDYEDVVGRLDETTCKRVAANYSKSKRIDPRIAELAQAKDGRRGSMVFGLIRDVAVGINGGLLPRTKMDEVRQAMLSAAKNRADGAMTEAEIDALVERHTADRADRAPDIFEILDYMRRDDAATDRICGRLFGRVEAPAPATVPPAPVLHDSDLDYIATVGAQNGARTASAKRVLDYQKSKHPKTADRLKHPDGIPKDKVEEDIKNLVAGARHHKFDDEPTDAAKLVLALVRGKTSMPLAEQTALAWAALHAPAPQDPTVRPEADDREPVPASRDSYEFLQNVVRALVACNERDPVHPRFILNLDGRPARLAKNVIEPLGRYSMNYELTTTLAPFRYEKNEETGEWSKKPDNMSSEVGELLLGMNSTDASKRFPIVELIANVPRLDPKTGEITRSGYDSNSRTFVILAADLLYEMPEGEITEQQLAAAISLIDELLHDFCFSSPADRANAFAMLLTGVLAGSWGDILTPLFAVDGAVQGSGKSLLCWIAAAMAGVVDEASSSGRQRGTEAELDKLLGFEMSKGRAAIILDNIIECLTSEELVRICTELRTSLRLNGGGTAMVRCNILKIVNGNRLGYSADLTKRVVRIYLDPRRPDPENRGNWKIGGVDELKSYVRKNLGKLIAALHVMVLAWIQAGRQEHEGAPTHGRFPDWSKIVGNVLAHAGISGFLANKDAVAAADEETSDTRVILTAVKAQIDRMQGTSFRAADVGKFLDADVRQVVLAGKHPDALNLLLGRWLGKHVNTPVLIDSATWALQSPGEDRKGFKLYQFERTQR